MAYNILNCNGWAAEGTGFVASMPCMKARLGIVLLFFGIAILRKWGGEEIGIGFSFLFALLIGIVPYLITISISGNVGLAMGLGVLGSLVGGYGAGIFFGGGEY